MGLESFFVLFLADGIYEQKDEFGIRKYMGESKISKSDLLEYLESKNMHVQDCRFIFEDAIVGLIDFDKNDLVKTISLECCFFHYDEGLELIFKLYKIMKDRFSFQLYHPGITLSENDNITASKEMIKDFYGAKYKQFSEQYGTETNGKKVLPNNGFVSYLEEIGRIK